VGGAGHPRDGGVGRALLAAIEVWARSWAARRIVLWVYRSNAGAIAFYRRLGFRRVLRGPDADAGDPYEAWALRRSIRARERS
jgi:ribosomal protein S18 acetylase RimI-like enzyme